MDKAGLAALRAVAKAARALQEDLIQRAEWDYEYVSAKVRGENVVPEVAAGHGVWSNFCDTLDALTKAEIPKP